MEWSGYQTFGMGRFPSAAFLSQLGCCKGLSTSLIYAKRTVGATQARPQQS